MGLLPRPMAGGPGRGGSDSSHPYQGKGPERVGTTLGTTGDIRAALTEG
jgi:hypothetical protein